MSNHPSENIYACPKGCKAQGGYPIAASVRGWKKHMSRQHGGYTQEELNAILGSSTPDLESGRAAFLSAADDNAPPAETGGQGGEKTAAAPGPSPEELKSLRTDATAKRLSAKMNKFKKSIADKLPQAVNNAFKDKGPEWAMDEEERAMLSEALENCFEVLDIDFQIAPIGMVLSNPLWVLLLPIATLLLIFGMKAVKNKKTEAEKTDDETVSVPT
jgi:hypothetical protein